MDQKQDLFHNLFHFQWPHHCFFVPKFCKSASSNLFKKLQTDMDIDFCMDRDLHAFETIQIILTDLIYIFIRYLSSTLFTIHFLQDPILDRHTLKTLYKNLTNLFCFIISASRNHFLKFHTYLYKYLHGYKTAFIWNQIIFTRFNLYLKEISEFNIF